MKEINNIFNENCLIGMKDIPEKSVSLILTDLPYGCTQNHWDSIIPLDQLWNLYKKVIKDNGAIVLFGQNKFSFQLIQSNPDWYRYSLVWNKVLPSGFLNVNRQFLRSHEDILVFYKKQPTYNPQKEYIPGRKNHSKGSPKKATNNNYGKFDFVDNSEDSEMKYPVSVLNFPKDHPSKILHSTQKPVNLLEFLIKSYSNEGDLVLDSCIGSGSTIEAAIRTGRNYIGFETDKKYFQIAQNRIMNIKEN